jgi:hypothetical protein
LLTLSPITPFQPTFGHALPGNVAVKCRCRHPCVSGGYKRLAELRVSAVIRLGVADIGNLGHGHRLRPITAMVASGKFVQMFDAASCRRTWDIIAPSSSGVAPLIKVMSVSILPRRKNMRQIKYKSLMYLLYVFLSIFIMK